MLAASATGSILPIPLRHQITVRARYAFQVRSASPRVTKPATSLSQGIGAQLIRGHGSPQQRSWKFAPSSPPRQVVRAGARARALRGPSVYSAGLLVLCVVSAVKAAPSYGRLIELALTLLVRSRNEVRTKVTGPQLIVVGGDRQA